MNSFQMKRVTFGQDSKEDRRCERCNKPLNKWVWLELMISTGKYRIPIELNDFDPDSQGLFAFGLECWRKVLKDGKEEN